MTLSRPETEFHIEAVGLTHVGMVRTINEDSYSIAERERLYIVADGMGGHQCGEIASKVAIETVTNFFRATSLDEELTWPYNIDESLSMAENRLVVSIRLANSRIQDISKKNKHFKGMGTTMVAAYYDAGILYVGYVGDSRLYRLRQGTLSQLSEDHSLLNQTMKYRQLSDDEIKNFSQKNVIVRALGINAEVQVDVLRHRVERGDLFLLCSDGLSGMASDAIIHDVMTGTADLRQMSAALIQKANDGGGKDNITVVVLRVA